jgi:hypothetical protein
VSNNASPAFGDRLLAIAFVLMVTVALAGITAGQTGASFTGTSLNPTNSASTLTVQPPASQNAPISAAGGVVDLSWTPTPTAPGAGHTLSYVILRGPVGGPYVQVGTSAGLTGSDTPASDGTYEYVMQARVAGGGTFTSVNGATRTAISDRLAPTVSITCNGGPCTGWSKAAVSVQVTGSDTGTGMGSVTRNVDGAGQVSTGGASVAFNVSGESAGHTVAYFGTDAAGNASVPSNATVKIDLTSPTTPGSFAAASGACCAAPYTMSFSWAGSTDALSGLAGYTLHWVATGGVTACPTTATPAAFPNTVSFGVGATNTTITNPAVSRICGYIESADNAGNASPVSPIVSGFAL